MGMTIKKKNLGNDRFLEIQKDTNMGNGEYYLYDVFEPANNEDYELAGEYKKLRDAYVAMGVAWFKWLFNR